MPSELTARVVNLSRLYKYGLDDSRTFAGRVQIHLMKGEFDAARRVIDAAERELPLTLDEPEPMDRLLSDIGVPHIICSILDEKHDAAFVRQLVRLSPYEIRKQTAHIGAATVTQISKRLRRIGIDWETEHDRAHGLNEFKGQADDGSGNGRGKRSAAAE